jgi:hypothetical protein
VLYGIADVKLYEIKLDIQTILFPLAKLPKICPDRGVIKMFATEYKQQTVFMLSIPIGATGTLDIACVPNGALD